MTTAVQFDPFSAVRDPECYEKMAELRRSTPVLEVMPGVFYLSRFKDVMSVYLDSETFINGGGHRISGEIEPEEQPIWQLDPPRHAPVRRLAMIALKPRAINASETYIAQLCARLVDAFARRGSANLVGEIAVPLPSTIIAHLIGFPEQDALVLREWVDENLNTPEAAGPPMGNRYDGESFKQLEAYTKSMMELRRGMPNPPDDMLTRMLQFRDESGKTFSDREIFAQVRALVSAGNETTTHLIGNTFYEMASRPEIYAQLRADRELVPVAVEESLRFYGPVTFIFRQASKDTEVAGTPVKAGQKVILGMASANRDETVYEHPEEFRLDRGKLLDHLGFGRGAHLCIGSSLARMEAISSINAVLDRIPEMRLAAGSSYENVVFSTMKGPKRVDVEFAPQV